MIENRTFFVEYESLENICATCGFCGHKSGGCVPTLAPEDDANHVGEKESKEPDKGDVGEWMVVQRRSKGRNQRTPQRKMDKAQSGSRFKSLSESDDEVDEEILADEIPTPPPSKVTASDPAMLAANLTAALSKAAHLQDNMPKNTVKKTTPKVCMPLADVTNKKIGDTAGLGAPITMSSGSDPDTSLVDIPIVYENPTFEGSKQSDTKAKGG
ncbi:hypothetical protein LINPERPRIM_LOCUS25537 [Linum perenne]